MHKVIELTVSDLQRFYKEIQEDFDQNIKWYDGYIAIEIKNHNDASRLLDCHIISKEEYESIITNEIFKILISED